MKHRILFCLLGWMLWASSISAATEKASVENCKSRVSEMVLHLAQYVDGFQIILLLGLMVAMGYQVSISRGNTAVKLLVFFVFFCSFSALVFAIMSIAGVENPW